MSAADRIARAADDRVANWRSVERAALVERLSARPAVKQLNHGFSVDIGEDLPRWCADAEAVRELLDKRARLAAELRDAA